MSTDDYENIKILLHKSGFKYIFHRDLFYNPVTHTIITQEFIQDKKKSEIEKIIEEKGTDPSFHFSNLNKLTPDVRKTLINELCPEYLEDPKDKGFEIDGKEYNRLRKEYDSYQDKFDKLLSYINTTIQNLLKETIMNCKKFERIMFKKRIKKFESCLRG